MELVVRKRALKEFRVVRRGNTDYAARAEAGITSAVLEAQTLQVDAVTGATTTSKAILKAAENALSAPPVKK